MLSNLISIAEHQTNNSLTEDELICLLKEDNRLIECIDLNERTLQAGYYIGVSWIVNKSKILYVKPKLDNEVGKVDFLKMLSVCLKYPEVLLDADKFFEIKFDEPTIKIQQQKDLITPLLMMYFLQLVKNIVKKGLKKQYYRITRNRHVTIKGKILVATNLKKNIFKDNPLDTVCSYYEFGINNPENRIIKKALLFIFRYLKVVKLNNEEFSPLMNYILPLFEPVEEDISFEELKSVTHNPFFSEYSKAVDLSVQILKRFGFNINLIQKNEEIDIPPFWIDMSKLFELYVLGKLKDALGANEILFQAQGKYGQLDFLRITKGNEMVLDAKYKPRYIRETSAQEVIDDVRQLSAYARDTGMLDKLSIDRSLWKKTVLRCIIIYPDQQASADINPEELTKYPIPQFERFYKIGISLPTIKL